MFQRIHLPVILIVIVIILSCLQPIFRKPESTIINSPTDSISLMTSTCPAPDPPRPIIGIVSHPGDGASGRFNNATNASYIAASYVKFVESAGARVIPLIYNEPIDIIEKKLNLVNGVLFTGGSNMSGLYFEIIVGIFKQVLKKNDKGEHFPLLAICLGFELLMMIISQNNNILEDFRALDQASTLQFMKNISIEETLFQRFPPELIAKLSIERLVMQNHKKLKLVNGVLFTGGWSKSGLYFDVIEGIFKQVLKKNDAGEHFPLLAICLGFELLTMIISQNNNILEDFSASDQASTLQFMNNINLEQTLFQRFPPELIAKLSTECLVMQNHKYGVSPETFQATTELCSFFKILTTSTDQNGKVYVSTVQSESYPVTAVQWHPEKNAFEWGSSMIPHSDDAIQVTQHVANFFISEARKSLNRPPTEEVLANLIYNYSPTYCGTAGKGFDEVYIFSNTEKIARL